MMIYLYLDKYKNRFITEDVINKFCADIEKVKGYSTKPGFADTPDFFVERFYVKHVEEYTGKNDNRYATAKSQIANLINCFPQFQVDVIEVPERVSQRRYHFKVTY